MLCSLQTCLDTFWSIVFKGLLLCDLMEREGQARNVVPTCCHRYPVFAVLAWSFIAFVRERNSGSLVQLIGSAFLLIVVLAHFAETYHLLPAMGAGPQRLDSQRPLPG